MSQPVLSTVESQEQKLMDNPFAPDNDIEQDGSNDLAKFLRWAHTRANPFSPEFLMELADLFTWMSNSSTIPEKLAPGRGILGRLDVAVEIIQAEKARLEGLYQEYQSHQAEVASQYSEAEAADWLKANMQDAYGRITRSSLNEPTKNQSELVQSAA